MQTFRTLELAIEFYDRAEKSEVKGHLREQLLRACSSIALNLSEGNARRSTRDKKRFYQTAYASQQECKTIFKLAKCKDNELIDQADKLGAWLYKLLKSEIPTKDFSKNS